MNKHVLTLGSNMSLIARIIVSLFIIMFILTVKIGPAGQFGDAMTSDPEIAYWSAEEVDAIFSQNVLVKPLAKQAERDLVKLGGVKNGVKFYRLLYETKDTNGIPVTASGLLALPDTDEHRLMLVSYQHGTILDNSYSPSAIANCPEAAVVAAIFAGRGYAVAMPDYLGMGSAVSFHPYFHAASEARSSADFLLAVKEFSKQKGLQFNNEIFLIGLSQGGHATMALQQLLEKERHVYDFDVAASAPIAGPYEITSVLQTWLDKPQWVSSPAIVRLLNAYDKVYHLSMDWKTVFRQPYAFMVDSMFDNELTMLKVAILPSNLQGLFTEEFLQKVVNKQGGLYEKIKENAVFNNWIPKSPVHLYHGKNDAIVPYKISEDAYHSLKEQGADVQLINVGDHAGHAEALIPACVDAKNWFDELRQSTEESDEP